MSWWRVARLYHAFGVWVLRNAVPRWPPVLSLSKGVLAGRCCAPCIFWRGSPLSIVWSRQHRAFLESWLAFKRKGGSMELRNGLWYRLHDGTRVQAQWTAPPSRFCLLDARGTPRYFVSPLGVRQYVYDKQIDRFYPVPCALTLNDLQAEE